MAVMTNGVPRPVIDAFELTPREREGFDYLDWAAIDEGRDSASFFRYRGELYDLGEFTVATHPAWDGVMPISYFTGIMVRYPKGDPNYPLGEYVIVGRWSK